MKHALPRSELLQQLQQDIRSLEGGRNHLAGRSAATGLGRIEQCFPNHTFPLGAVHEFLSKVPEDAAATNGFIAALLGKLMLHDGVCLWVSTHRSLFAPALKIFGVLPEQIIFVDLRRDKEALWAIEQALKCTALTAVVGELGGLSFTESRRLQLAVEESSVTGFLHRFQPRSVANVACSSRWQISALPSTPEAGMPGVGFPRWQVQLLKMRNGKPGSWQVEWAAGSFRYTPLSKQGFTISSIRKAG